MVLLKKQHKILIDEGVKHQDWGLYYHLRQVVYEILFSSDKLMSDNELISLVGIVGILSALSTVNVDLKKLFNSSADSMFDDVIDPSDFCSSVMSCLVFCLLFR